MCAATAEIGSLGMTIGVLVAAIPNGDCGIACRPDRAGVDTTILRLGLWNLFILKTTDEEWDGCQSEPDN
jgi:hypothetical protein